MGSKMIKQIIRLTRPGVFLPYFQNEYWPQNEVLVRPTFLSICAADQRYFNGDRPEHILHNKLPMALLHEAVGEVLYDPTGKFSTSDRVALIPCVIDSQVDPILENYREKSLFHSSNIDGFAQEFLSIPHNQLVGIERENEKIYVFSELVSVCIHAIRRWQTTAKRESENELSVWGDGTLAYILSLALKHMEPGAKITVFGKHDAKLALFSFVDATINIRSKSKTRFHHAFECIGGEGAASAINNMIELLHPQGSIFLLGVSENYPAIHTRLILEKGLALTGCSRSGRHDFVMAIDLIGRKAFRDNLDKIIQNEISICGSNDLEYAFNQDRNTPFKTVLKWNV